VRSLVSSEAVEGEIIVIGAALPVFVKLFCQAPRIRSRWFHNLSLSDRRRLTGMRTIEMGESTTLR
jgi:hypothetical protein